ncbi:transposase [Candidatus Arsenophonus triatominarum]|uniref:transposase n=1 Tax=Candidatus Arsenophonus triatominarum TaxID=57911 RepID=UPI0007C4CAEB|nr:transposase [Candidatus Arsenophonus triatominarum]
MDESGFSHDTPRTHGYSPKGHRCFGLKNWGAKGRTNVIGALLGTTLFFMDNASFHKGKNIEQAIINAGHQIEYLPVYSPDLNPIEHKWSQAKRKKMETGCTIDDLFLIYML